jgi:hypothetical protein
VIAPVVPPLLPASGWAAAPGVAVLVRGPLPLPTLSPRRTSTVVYGLSALDDRGRLADRVIMRTLGWSAGLCLDIRETAGVLTVLTDPTGVYQVTGQGHLRLPAALRHRCGLRAGDALSWLPTPSGPGWTSTRPQYWTPSYPGSPPRQRVVSPHDHPPLCPQRCRP